MRRWLAALARAAAARGQVTAASELWQAAGCWGEALALAALTGDLDALRRHAATVRMRWHKPCVGYQWGEGEALALAALAGDLDALRRHAATVRMRWRKPCLGCEWSQGLRAGAGRAHRRPGRAAPPRGHGAHGLLKVLLRVSVG